MELGKFPAELLERMLAKNHITDPRVVLGPGVGEDAAAIDMGGRLLVAKSDPITFATEFIGWYAVQVNANDVAFRLDSRFVTLIFIAILGTAPQTLSIHLASLLNPFGILRMSE